MNSKEHMRVFRAGIQDISLARKAICDVHIRSMESNDALIAFLNDELCFLYIAVVENEVVGSLNGYKLIHPHRRDPQYLLYEIDVIESWHRQGIGTQLINAFVSEAKNCGAFEVWVITNDANFAAMGMYHKCGFNRISPDDVVFSMDLENK